jgi:pimeloyl-ACP methyl ester carboxylesterase
VPTVPTNGIVTSYERTGDGPPVWILHGGLEDGRDWSWLATRLAARWTVTVPDRRGHGRTPDAPGAYSYGQMTDDVVAAVEQLEGGPVSVVGYSDGGNVALDLAARRPDLVTRVVAISADVEPEGIVPSFRERLAHPDPDAPPLAPMRDAYAEVSPDGPGHWAEFHGKVCAMGLTGIPGGLAALRAVRCPTLVLAADDDVIAVEHTLAIFGAVERAQLGILPGTSHLMAHERPDLLGDLVEAFLEDDTPTRVMPVRFAHP